MQSSATHHGDARLGSFLSDRSGSIGATTRRGRIATNELGVRNDRAAVHVGVGLRGGADDVGPTWRRRKVDRHGGVEILGGAMDGKALSASEVDALAKLPSLDQLRAQIIGLLNAPASKIVGVVDAPASKLARVFAAYGAKEGA